MILAGDIGGTKTRLALCHDEGPRVIREDMYLAEEHASLEAMLDKFLRGRDVESLIGACFGVAGPVDQGRAKITNLPWLIDAKALSQKLGGVPVSLLNDLQATALGTLVLPPESFAMLQAPATTAKDGPIAVIAPGTGLGEALLVSERGRYRALPSEGGHADFAPTTEEEIDLLRYLRKLYNGHVSYERVLSGDGIGDLYNFVRLTTGGKEPTWLAAQIASGDRNAVV
jgi:glucokinase